MERNESNTANVNCVSQNDGISEPHLKPGGVLVMHDYGWAERVQRVVKEIIQTGQVQKGHLFENIYWARF